jgi:hypothetical protein
MDYKVQYFRGSWDYKPLPEITVQQLWHQVATIRLRNGDRKGAARARRNAKMSVAIKYMKGKHSTVLATVHLMAGIIPCNVAATHSVRRTEDPTKVTCRNCIRTKSWLFTMALSVSCPDCLAYANMNCWKVKGLDTVLVCYTNVHVGRIPSATKQPEDRV